MPMRVGEFHTAIHSELERRLMDLDSGRDLNPFIRLVRTKLGKLIETHNIDAHLLHVHSLEGNAFGSHIHLGDRRLNDTTRQST